MVPPGTADIRNPSIGLLGLYADDMVWDHFGGINASHVAVEGERYWGRWAVAGIAGVEFGNNRSGTSWAATVTTQAQAGDLSLGSGQSGGILPAVSGPVGLDDAAERRDSILRAVYRALHHEVISRLGAKQAADVERQNAAHEMAYRRRRGFAFRADLDRLDPPCRHPKLP